jgi:phosphate transport system ATP-binding protein
MSADEPTMSLEKPTISPGDTTMSADESSPPSPTRRTTMSPEDQHTQMLDPSRSQSSKSPQSAPSASAQARTNVSDGLAVKLEQLRAFYGDVAQVKGIDLDFHANEVTAIIGPSGCGKSTMVRCINRMHEEVPGARAEGKVLLDGFDIYDSSVDVVAVRRAIGMVFQKPNPFPTMSVFDNVAAGLRLASRGRGDLHNKVETALRGAGLWEEVKDRLSEAGAGLSGGQQQRLCIARSLAVEPEVILMDEPCSALDPIATLKIEELIDQLKSKVTIVIVTHNMQQAARVADRTAFMLSGELIEVGPTQQIFTNPHDSRTEEYVTGKFG